MIITYDVMFGYVNTIIFQLSLRIGIVAKSCEAVYEENKNMLAFSYLAIPTRHEVPMVPMG